MSPQQEDLHWNAGATEIQQLSPEVGLAKDRA